MKLALRSWLTEGSALEGREKSSLLPERLCALESAEEIAEHRFIPKIGTEELWPVIS